MITILFQFQAYPEMVYKLFKQYGEIESIRLGRSEGIDFVLAQFKNDAAINDLVKKGEIELDGSKFVIKSFHEIPNSKDELINCIESLKNLNIANPPPPEGSHENILEALNDDCLSQIFEKIHYLADIHSITNVCKHFYIHNKA